MVDRKNIEKLPPVVELGGRTWQLRLTHNAMMLFSSTTRCPLYQLPDQITRYDYMVLLLWLMLHEQDGQLKREKFDGWLEALGVRGVLKQFMDPITAAVTAAFPEAEEDEDAEDAEDSEAGTADPT